MALLAHSRSLWVFITASLLFVACSGGGLDDEFTAGGGPSMSPLAEYLGVSSDVDASSRAGLEVFGAELREEFLQRCMLAQGFQYSPVPIDSGRVWFIQELPPEEHARVYGFALSTTFETILYSSTEDDSPVEEYAANKNYAHVETLSEQEQNAWYIALRGEEPTVDESTGQLIDPETGEPMAWEDFATIRGCEGQAEISNGPSAVATLATTLADLDARVGSDPRSVALRKEWVTCMQEAGYSFQDQNEMFQATLSDFRPLRKRVLSAVGSDPSNILPIPNNLKVELDNYKEQEIATAVASFECDDQASHDAIRYEYERQLIADDGDLLDSLIGSQ